MASAMPALEMGFSLYSMALLLALAAPWLRLDSKSRKDPRPRLIAAQFAKEHGYWIVELVYYALLQRDDGVIGDVTFFGADFGAAFCNVAEAQAEIFLEKFRAGDAIEGMHFKTGDAHEETGSGELLLLGVVAQHVADVLTEETLDAFAEFLAAVDVDLLH